MKELDEADAAFGQAPGEQTIRSKRARLLRLFTVKLERARRLFGNIRQLGNRSLHPKGHFILRDARGNFGIAEFLETDLVQLAYRVEKYAPVFALKAGRVGEIENGIADRTEL